MNEAFVIFKALVIFSSFNPPARIHSLEESYPFKSFQSNEIPVPPLTSDSFFVSNNIISQNFSYSRAFLISEYSFIGIALMIGFFNFLISFI